MSATGLILLTLGLIEAGQRGWTDAFAVSCMALGLAVVATFVLLERRTARSGGTPMVDPALFEDRSYTWGVILAAVAVLAMIGVLFTLPQFFQGVLGVSAAESGLRLVPLIVGIALAAIPADRIASAVGRKLVVVGGFVVLATGLTIGARTTVHSPVLFVAGWTLIAGLGVGLSVATSTSAALSALSDEQSGIGSAVLQAVNKTGAPFGAALLGSVLSVGYLAHLAGSPVLATLPAEDVGTVRSGLFGALRVANQSRSDQLLDVARAGFTAGMSTALLVSAGVAVVGAVLAGIFMPSQGNRVPGRVSHSDAMNPRGRREDERSHDAKGTGAGASPRAA